MPLHPARRLRRASLLAALISPLSIAGSVQALELYDQQNLGMTGSINFKLHTIGQSFTPAFDTLDFVVLFLGCCDTSDPGPVTLRVDIRDGSLAGPIVATTPNVVVPDGTGGAWIQFPLSVPISVTPGGTYVIDFVLVSGGTGVISWSGFYPGGEGFVDGSPGTDFAFRTGIFTDVAPQTLDPGAIPVEYSNHFDEGSAAGGGHGAADPGQMLYTEPPDDAADADPSSVTDFVPGIESGTEPDAQVDALAHGFDVLVTEVVNGEADLVVSFAGDSVGGAEVATVRERPFGAKSVLFSHLDLDASDAPGVLDDLDGIDLWGPPGAADALYYSLEGDALSGTSIFVDVGGVPAAYLSHADVVTAVTSLGYAGAAADVDVDALMVRNVGSGTEFDLGDVILFSIRATPVGGFDGGEIVQLPFAGSPSFLVHGGHTWDTAFDVATAFGSASEDVDGLEAWPASSTVPSTGWAAGVLLGLVVLAVARAASRLGRAEGPR